MNDLYVTVCQKKFPPFSNLSSLLTSPILAKPIALALEYLHAYYPNYHFLQPLHQATYYEKTFLLLLNILIFDYLIGICKNFIHATMLLSSIDCIDLQISSM
jgi:hypothetical protein